MQITLNREELFTVRKNKKVFKPLPEVCKLMRTKTFLMHSRFFPSIKEYFVYDDSEGIYIKYDEDGFRSIVGTIFYKLNVEPDYYVISRICNHFKVGPLSVKQNNVEVNLDLICFKNGVLRLSTGEFSGFSPKYFLISKLKFDYDANAVLGPIFKDYLKTFCNDNLDKEIFIRSWFKILVCKYKGTQTFIYVQGQAKTGKSLLGHIASCLIGDTGTVVTSLRSLNNDPFEIYNLKDKQLIIVSDTESYSGDLSILKQVVGGDPLKGRIKFVQGNMDLYVSGILMIIGNYGINSQDSSGALQRRMRLFKADKIVKNSRPLLYRDGINWGGPLVDELPGIFNWINAYDLKESIKVLENPQLMIPSAAAEMENELVSLDPLLSWVQESIKKGNGSYLGYCNLSIDTKDLLEMRRRSLLYPSYALYCKQRGFRPLKHKMFSLQLLITLKNSGYTCNKIKQTHGVYIQGITLKPESFQTDTMYGGPITYDVQVTPEVNEVNSLTSQTSDFINRKIYKDYVDLLSKQTPEKKILNSFIRKNVCETNIVVDEYFKDHEFINDNYRDLVSETFHRNIHIVKKYGAIPYNYKRMGISPRIIPVNYGDTLNNTKRILRNKVYSIMSNHMEQYSIVDFDLKSCYTSILLGLYPEPLNAVRQAIEGPGLWNYIKSEFKKKGRMQVFNKPAVKICVYSSLFLGGHKAMMEGIIDNFRKDVGMTKPDWRKSSHYEKAYSLAQDVTSEMINSSVVLDFRHIAEIIKAEYIGKEFIGPTNHNYKVTEENFRNVFPNYLQSYEITLLGMSALDVAEKFPEVQFIGHYHDGNVLLIRNDILQQVIYYYQERVTYYGLQLKLAYKQELEVKQIFD